jgi:hypothetical protein
LQQGLLWINPGIKVDNHGYQNNQNTWLLYITVLLKCVLEKKNPGIHLELSGTRRFFEVVQPPKTGGSLFDSTNFQIPGTDGSLILKF